MGLGFYQEKVSWKGDDKNKIKTKINIFLTIIQ